ncbi:MAG: TonB-dependent receptor [Caulobacteraceae bacterium]|nr:TonB-dependent receptor [Caulobacteraceae bacterium]
MTRLAMLCGMTAVGALLHAEPALSAVQKVNIDAQQEFRIPSQPLETALLQYSRQSGLQVISSSPVVANKVAPAMNGRSTPRQALEALLRSSNLSFVASGSTVTIVPASAPQAGALVRTELLLAAPADSPDSAPVASFATAPAAADQTSSSISAESPATPRPDLEELTVTGTRIIRNGYQSPTPVMVAPIDQLEQTTPSNIPDALNKLPEFAGSTTQSSSSNGTTQVQGNFLNLRGLRPGRTLILLNGMRVPATSGTNQVDTNTLPQMLVQRVDVVTGGASAAYGSDAVAGVVNYIVNTKYNGFKALAQTGVSQYGDANSVRLGIAAGTSVLGKGHLEFSLEHFDEAGFSQLAREFSNTYPLYVGKTVGSAAAAGTVNNPYTVAYNTRVSNAAFGGYVASGPTSMVGQQFVGGGTLAPFNPGTATGTSGVSVGGDGAYAYNMQLFKPLQTDQIFGRFDYELPHGITAFVDVSAAWSKTHWIGTSSVVNTTLYSGNPYLPASVQAALTGTGTLAKPQFASFTMNSLLQDLAVQGEVRERTQATTVFGGLEGKIFNDAFRWNAYASHGEGVVRVTNLNNINNQHFYAALDAVKDSSGAIVCNVSTTASANLYPGCAPLNILGVGNESAAALAYIYQDTYSQALNKVDDVSASISGAPFNNWAGPVSAALNVEYRRQSLSQTTNADPTIAPSYTGLRPTWVAGGRTGSAAPTAPFQAAGQASLYGENSVWEVSGETVVPLLKKLPLIENLEFNGAVRYTNYSTSGGVTSWKAGLEYQPFGDLRFRGTKSRDIRAPNLFELYQSASYGTTTIAVDPHTGVSNVAVTQVNVGNPNLVPEVADTVTVGAVYSPSWFPGFRMSVDYYDINITGVIGTALGMGANVTATALAVCEASGGTSSYCSVIQRPLPFSNHSAANVPTLILNQSINQSSQLTRGIDLEASYAFDMAAIHRNLPGRTDTRLLINYAPDQIAIAYPDAPPINAAGNGVAATRLTGLVNYSLGPFRASWQSTWSSAHHRGSGSGAQFYADPEFPPLISHDLNLSYRFKTSDGRNLQTFLAINNLFNAQPQFTPSTASPGSTISPAGDVRGRYFTAGVRFGY